MPVTPAHCVFAPPLARWTGGRLPLSALAVGCVTPDVEYLLHLRPVSTWGHTPAGLLAWDLPLGLALLALFHHVARPALPLLVPDDARGQIITIPAWRWGGPARWLGVAAAIVIGAASHVALDACTHERGWVVARVAPLRERVAGLHVYSWLQYGLGLLFLAVLARWTVRWLRATAPASVEPGLSARGRVASWVVIIAITLIAALANGAWQAGPSDWRGFVACGAFAAHAAVGVLAVGFGLIARARAWPLARGRPAS